MSHLFTGFRFRLQLLIAVVTLAAGTGLQAKNIQWFCDPLSTNLTSDNRPIDSDFRFELGVFANGFVPTSSNVPQWSANWVSAQRALYNDSNRLFTAEYKVTGNTAPFTTGSLAYVWGFGGRGGDEWILFRAPSWTWPTAAPIDPNALQWNAAAATAIVGSIQSSGTPFLMKTAVCSGSPPMTSWATWRTEMLNGVVLNGANDDPDKDGVSNALEFVFGGHPLVPQPPSAAVVSYAENGGQYFLQTSFARRADRTASLLVEVSDNLTTWTSGPSATGVTFSGPNLLSVRSLTSVTSPPYRQFMRLKVTVP